MNDGEGMSGVKISAGFKVIEGEVPLPASSASSTPQTLMPLETK